MSYRQELQEWIQKASQTLDFLGAAGKFRIVRDPYTGLEVQYHGLDEKDRSGLRRLLEEGEELIICGTEFHLPVIEEHEFQIRGLLNLLYIFSDDKETTENVYMEMMDALKKKFVRDMEICTNPDLCESANSLHRAVLDGSIDYQTYFSALSAVLQRFPSMEEVEPGYEAELLRTARSFRETKNPNQLYSFLSLLELAKEYPDVLRKHRGEIKETLRLSIKVIESLKNPLCEWKSEANGVEILQKLHAESLAAYSSVLDEQF